MSDAPFTRLLHLERAGSTSTLLREAVTDAPEEWPHLSAVVADHQTEGHGRTGRPWLTPAGGALTASVLVRPRVPVERLSWLTLLTGLATVRALGDLAPADAARIGLKWPNDVVVDTGGTQVEGWDTHRKLGGILAEVVPGPVPSSEPDRAGRPAVVVGIGVNVAQQAEELPVPWATSLRAAGIAPGTEPLALLTAVGHRLRELLATWESAEGDAARSGLREAVAASCLTLGRQVRVTGPGDRSMQGVAEAIDDDGRLVLRDDDVRTAVVAGDVGHVRKA